MKYLLCYDGSEFAQAALDQLLGMVRATDAVTVFGATEVTKKKLSDIGISYGTPETHVMQRTLRKRLYHLELAVEKQFKDAGVQKTDVLIVTTSDIRRSVLKAAADESADCIVVGTRGHSGLKRMLVGSLSDHLVTNSPVPVLVVPGSAAAAAKAKAARDAAAEQVADASSKSDAAPAPSGDENGDWEARVDTDSENFDLVYDTTTKVGVEKKE